MKYINLTQGLKAIIDDEDYASLSQWNWHVNSYGYAVGYLKKQKIKLHRLIMGDPVGIEIDHINGNKLDNRKGNLRLATRQQNAWNTCKNLRGGSSIYKGVTLHKANNRWRARITFNGKIKPLGLFKKEHHAAMAYDIWAKDIHSEFAKLNFREDKITPL